MSSDFSTSWAPDLRAWPYVNRKASTTKQANITLGREYFMSISCGLSAGKPRLTTETSGDVGVREPVAARNYTRQEDDVKDLFQRFSLQIDPRPRQEIG